jgi:hypothetical protein
MQYDEVIEYRLVSYQYNWTFTPIWKNATASIFSAFSKKFTEIHSEKLHNIHNIAYRLPKNDDLKMLHKNSSEYLNFANQSNNIVCLRDPYERLISAFYHKIILNPGGVEARDFFSKNKVDGLSNLEILNRFVAYLKTTNEIDPHFISQTTLGNLNDINYHHIINFNNLNNEWKNLQNIYPNIPNLDKNKIHETGSGHFANEVRRDNKMFKRIEMLYLDDYNFIRKNMQ